MSEENRRIALGFLEAVIAGRIDEAYARHVDMGGRHHNVYYAAGFAVLREGMKENHATFPDKRLSVKSVVAEGDRVAVHSHVVLKPGELEISAVHLFRIAGGKIAEMWDVPLILPPDCPNKDGFF